jgi:hypothetical protein
MVEIDQYCKNPYEYSSSLPQETIDYYDSICEARSKIDTSSPDWNALGDTFVNLPAEFIEGMLSPEGLALLSVFMGVDLASEVALNAMYRSIAKGIGEEVMVVASKLAIEEGTTLLTVPFINNAIMCKVLTSAVEAGTTEALAFSFLKLVSAGASIAMSIFNILLILALILDSWDPAGYNQMLDADILDEIVRQFNTLFVMNTMPNIVVGNDEFGRPIYVSSWPFEYYADYTIANEKADEYDVKSFEYNIEYLSSLKYNSEGKLICYGKQQKTLIDSPMVERAAAKFSMILADKNTVVSGWIYKYWPLLVVLFILIVLFLVFVR